MEKAAFATLMKPAMQLADRNHARAHGRQWLVARRQVQLAHRRSLVAMGEPQLGEGCVCSIEETGMQLADRNQARARRRQWLVATPQVQLAG